MTGRERLAVHGCEGIGFALAYVCLAVLPSPLGPVLFVAVITALITANTLITVRAHRRNRP